MVLYRKYRSKNFAEVVGQDHIVKTLSTALASNRLSHAYLFTGPRGTGKTSVARLLARALNCTGEPRPCNQCDHCKSALGSSLDILEIDAASNRSIDSIRELKDKIALAPNAGKYKIYIIDEVHMLTTEAFNALLKTLEEPPAHAVFIMATTEAHKLPDTIVSRTQRFTFRPIGQRDLTTHLANIAKAERINIEPEALKGIATVSRGSFRDAISLLDQLSSATTETITGALMRELLGLSDVTQIFSMNHAIAQKDPRTALEILQALYSDGAQPAQVATQMAEQWRSAILASTGASPSADQQTQELSNSATLTTIADIMTELLEVTRSHWPGLALEATVVRLAAPQPEMPTTEAPLPTTKAKSEPKPTPQPKTTRTSQPPPNPSSSAPIPNADTATDSVSGLDATLWPKVVVLIKQQNNSLGALMQMYPVHIASGEVTIKPRFNFHRDLFMKPSNIRIIEAAAAKVYQRTVKVSAKTDNPDAKKLGPKPDPSAELISSALEILGGEVVE